MGRSRRVVLDEQQRQVVAQPARPLAEPCEDGVQHVGQRLLRGDRAERLEVEVRQLASVIEQRQEVVAAVQAAGYRYVTLDLQGFRSGNLNDSLGNHAK